MLIFQNRRYLMFALLYFAQGAILSYFTALNALYLLSFNLSMAQVGLFSAIALIPFVLKIFLGIISDRHSLLGRGHRVPYIVIGLLTQAICLLIAPFINPGTHFGLFAGLAFLLMTGMALYDTCTDGLALDTTPEADQGAVQGLMVSGRALGVVVVSAVIGAVAHWASWQAAFWGLAAITLLPLPLALTAREPARPADLRFQWGAFRAFGRPKVIALGVLGLLYSLIINGANEVVNPFLQKEYHISYLIAGFYTAAWGVGVVIGGLAGGRLSDRIGHRRSVLGALIVAGVAIAALAAIRSPWMAWPLVITFGFAFGFYEAVYFATAMSLADRRIAASMFAILMGIANLGVGIGLAAAGSLSDAVGFRPTFLILAALNVVVFLMLPWVFGRRQPQQGVSAA
jgi:PAT family beta-lactamase induction signal transducer AmpG